MNPGGGTTLTDTYIGFGDSSNLLTGSANFTFTEESGGSGPTVLLTGDVPRIDIQDDTGATDYKTRLSQSGASLFVFHMDSTGTNREVIRISNSYVRFNDDGLDIDIKMEGENEENLFKLDAAQDNIGIGGSPASDALLHVYDEDDRFSAATLRVQKNYSTDGDAGPILELYRYDSATVSGSTQGSLRFYGTDDDGDTKVHYSQIKSIVNPVGAGTAGSGWLYLQASASDREGAAFLILTGRFIGFLPEHVAEQWVAAGKLRALHTATQHYRIPFVLITRHDRRPNRVVDAFLGFISGGD